MSFLKQSIEESVFSLFFAVYTYQCEMRAVIFLTWLSLAAIGVLASSIVEIVVIAGDAENEDAEVARYTVDVPAAGMSAYYAMRRSPLKMDVMELGGKSVVMGLAGIRHQLPQTGWILFHTHNQHTHPNVNLAETHVRPGDTLLWRLMKMGTQPTPEPLATSAVDAETEPEVVGEPESDDAGALDAVDEDLDL